ncbi:hypothetical protein FMUBM48_12880 [Nocardia cyriacigeorgica]|nr:hypothetical protein FMUBM48_12880 [Nocardia cyriacigeorgica]
MQRRVADHNRLRERHRSRKVHDRAGNRGDWQPIDLHHIALFEVCCVHNESLSDASTAGTIASHVHLLDRQAPHRQIVGERRRDMADYCSRAQPVEGSPGRYQMTVGRAELTDPVRRQIVSAAYPLPPLATQFMGGDSLLQGEPA